jgi:hypothetical protein
MVAGTSRISRLDHKAGHMSQALLVADQATFRTKLQSNGSNPRFEDRSRTVLGNCQARQVASFGKVG